PGRPPRAGHHVAAQDYRQGRAQGRVACGDGASATLDTDLPRQIRRLAGEDARSSTHLLLTCPIAGVLTVLRGHLRVSRSAAELRRCWSCRALHSFQADSLRSPHPLTLARRPSRMCSTKCVNRLIPNGLQRPPERRGVTDITRCACHFHSWYRFLPHKT